MRPPSRSVDRESLENYHGLMETNRYAHIRRDAILAAFCLMLGALLGGIATMSGLIWFEIVSRP